MRCLRDNKRLALIQNRRVEIDCASALRLVEKIDVYAAFSVGSRVVDTADIVWVLDAGGVCNAFGLIQAIPCAAQFRIRRR